MGNHGIRGDPRLDQARHFPLNPNDHITNKYIIPVSDVEEQLIHPNFRKVPVQDNLPNWVLYELPGVLALPICAIVNCSMRKLPGLWKSATTCPISKKTPARAVETDLRPISLTCILPKELERPVLR